MPGRPTELTPDVRTRIVAALAAGNHRGVAARLGGVSPRTLRHWLARGRDGHEPYSTLLADVKKAEADAHVKCIEAIKLASLTQWQAAAWLLERKYPHLWGSNRREIAELQKQIKELAAKIG